MMQMEVQTLQSIKEHGAPGHQMKKTLTSNLHPVVQAWEFFLLHVGSMNNRPCEDFGQSLIHRRQNVGSTCRIKGSTYIHKLIRIDEVWN